MMKERFQHTETRRTTHRLVECLFCWHFGSEQSHIIRLYLAIQPAINESMKGCKPPTLTSFISKLSSLLNLSSVVDCRTKNLPPSQIDKLTF
jgi:hypothetical protein